MQAVRGLLVNAIEKSMTISGQKIAVEPCNNESSYE